MYGGGTNGAGEARKLEQERQARIEEGMRQINATFGGTRGTNLATAYTPGSKYYDQWGAEWNPTIASGDELDRLYQAADRAGNRNNRITLDQFKQQLTEKAYQDAIKSGKLYGGTETSGGFDDAFYQKRADDVVAYEMPQFADQYQTTRNSLAANLARRGLLGAGAAVKSQASLDKFADTKRREIADAGIASANQLRGQVNDAKSQLTSQLIASGDPAAISSGVISQAGELRRPTAMPALGNLFSDWVNVWKSNQQAQTYDPSVQPLFSFGSPGGAGSMRIVKG